MQAKTDNRISATDNSNKKAIADKAKYFIELFSNSWNVGSEILAKQVRNSVMSIIYFTLRLIPLLLQFILNSYSTVQLLKFIRLAIQHYIVYQFPIIQDHNILFSY